MQLGATFSHRHLRYLGHDPRKALVSYFRLGLPWIRLGCYWSDIEPAPGTFMFDELDTLVELCEKHRTNVILTVGMKAPRYPEYYLPPWLSTAIPFHHHAAITPDNHQLLYATHMYLYNVINHFKRSPAIKIYQVENEPLDPSGSNRMRIGPEFLAEEVRLVKSLDPSRKILVTVWGNEASRRNVFAEALPYADIIGLDVYYRQPVSFLFRTIQTYIGPLDSVRDTKRVVSRIREAGKQFWITELQAEPWESGELVTTKSRPPSFLPAHFAVNGEQGKSLRPAAMLLWGFEWWYHQKQTGNPGYWSAAEKYIGGLNTSR